MLKPVIKRSAFSEDIFPYNYVHLNPYGLQVQKVLVPHKLIPEKKTLRAELLIQEKRKPVLHPELQVCALLTLNHLFRRIILKYSNIKNVTKIQGKKTSYIYYLPLNH